MSLDDELIRINAPSHVLAEIARYSDAVGQPRRRRLVDEAQAVSEGIRLDRHRATWSYSRAISAQRRRVLAERVAVAERGTAHGLVRRLLPEHLARLEAARGPAVERLVRDVVLYFLDDRWVDHLAGLQEVRDGIHLRALAGYKPAEEFHRIALRQFHDFFEEVYRAAADFLSDLVPADVGREVQELGLVRPSASWTYMTTDDPYGSASDRLAGALGRRWRHTVLRIE